MGREKLFFFVLGIVAAGYVLYEGMFLVREYTKTLPAEGTVCEIREEGHSRWRRKYVRFRCRTDQGTRESENIIPISLSAYTGMKRKIRYFAEQPRIVSAHSVRHLVWGTAFALAFLTLSFLA